MIRPLAAAAAAMLLAGCATRMTADQIHVATLAQLEEARPTLEASSVPEANRRAGELLGWSADDTRRVAAGEIWQGMSAEQLWWSWGRPLRVTTEDTPQGRYEHWLYSLSPYRPRSVTLYQNGVLWWHLEETR